MHPISKERQCPCGHLAASCALKKTQSRVPSLSMEFAFFIYCLFKANFSTKEINMLTRQSLQTIYQRKTQIRQKLSIPEKTLERHIKILRDAGLIEYKGSKKTGGYYIVHDRDASNEGITEGINRGINEGINEL